MWDLRCVLSTPTDAGIGYHHLAHRHDTVITAYALTAGANRRGGSTGTAMTEDEIVFEAETTYDHDERYVRVHRSHRLHYERSRRHESRRVSGAGFNRRKAYEIISDKQHGKLVAWLCSRALYLQPPTTTRP